MVNLVLELDTEPRIVPIPRELNAALKENEKAKTAWGKLKPSKQKEILSYLNWLKTPAAMQRNVEKIIKVLLEQHMREKQEVPKED